MDLAPAARTSVNVLQGSEIPEGAWWDTLGVRVETERVTLAGQERTSYHLTKETPESWGRLQQVVPLLPNTPYTVSAWVKAPQGAALPGIQGRGQAAAGATFTLRSALSDGVWRAQVDGPGRVLSSGIAAEEGHWQRVGSASSTKAMSPGSSGGSGFRPTSARRRGARRALRAFSSSAVLPSRPTPRPP